VESKPFNPVIDHALEHHGVSICFSLGFLLLLAGYLGMHWIARRRYCRKHRCRTAPRYFVAWFVRTVEGYLGVFFLLSAMAGRRQMPFNGRVFGTVSTARGH
jgi:hypothetical protein